MNEYGLRWSEWGRDNRPHTKEKWFATAEQRQTFAAKVSEKDTFHEFVAFCDPKISIH